MKLLYLLLAACLMLASCKDDLDPASGEYEGPVTTARISFAMAAMKGDVTTRATDPATVDDTQIKDIWVLQFQSGVFRRSAYFYDNVNTANFEVGLVPGASNIYFVANAGATAFTDNPASEAAFKTTAKAITTEDGLLLTAATGLKSIPMYGELPDQTVPSSGYMEGLTVTLTRILARIDLTYTFDPALDATFELKKVRVCNVPKNMQYYTPQTALFPVSPDHTSIQSFEYTDEGIVSNAGGTLTFFLPDNRRGTGTNTGSDPRLKGPFGYSTYIELVGYTKGTQGGDEVSYRIYPGADNLNDYNIERNTQYAVTSAIKGVSPTDLRVIRLDRANCYMVAPGRSVLIPVKRANDSALGIQIADVSSSDWTASLNWETVNGLVTVSTSETDRSFGMFKVTAPSGSAKGNAQVVVKNTAGDVLWSWHIWVTPYASDLQSGLSNTATYGGTIFMHYNLGATEIANNYSTISYAFTTGMYYQWGRKDPFLPPNGNSTSTISIYNNSITNHPSGSTMTGDPYSRYYVESYANNLVSSVRYPMTYLTTWAGSTATEAAAYTQAGGAYSWGGEYGQPKSVYDPCPAGWRVNSAKKNSTTWTSAYDAWTNATYSGGSFPCTPSIGSMYFPYGGYRDNSGGFLSMSSRVCISDAAVTTSGGPALYIDSNSSTVNKTSNFGYRSYAMPVRCVKEW